MSLARLKAWLRANGLQPGEKGRAILQRNRSYVFFRLEADSDPALGPIGGAGIALTPLRSIAIDRTIWSYGLPFWIDAELPWEREAVSPFRRLMIAHDTGSAILGPARADIFFGGGEAAGTRAGAILDIRGAFVVPLAAWAKSRERARRATRQGALAPAQRRRNRAVDRSRQDRRQAASARRTCRRYAPPATLARPFPGSAAVLTATSRRPPRPPGGRPRRRRRNRFRPWSDASSAISRVGGRRSTACSICTA